MREAMQVAGASAKSRKAAISPSMPKVSRPAVESESEYAHHEEYSAPTPSYITPSAHPPERASASSSAAEEDEGELTVDIYDHGDSIIIQSTVAGVAPDDLDVSVTNDTVTIRGRRARPENISDDAYYYKELFWGTFSRSVLLPEEIEEEVAEASLVHGLLTLRLPKKRRGVVQKVKVKAL